MDALASQGGDLFLDLCSGTGAVSLEIARRKKRVVSLDFSEGMIKRAREKAEKLSVDGVYFVIADATCLPFKDGVFDGVSISHAFYEVKGEDGKKKLLLEARRVLKSGGIFCMMEHEVPKNPFVRLLFYLRIMSMGRKDGVVFLKKEMDIIRGVFGNAEKRLTPSGKSKLICARKLDK